MISPSIWLAMAMAVEDFPEAVGPQMKIGFNTGDTMSGFWFFPTTKNPGALFERPGLR